MKHIGQLIQQRREAMGMTQSALARTMGGYPSASLMSRIEAGEVELTPSSAAKYAEVLRLPRDLMLNAGGFATPDQHAAALGRQGHPRVGRFKLSLRQHLRGDGAAQPTVVRRVGPLPLEDRHPESGNAANLVLRKLIERIEVSEERAATVVPFDWVRELWGITI